MTRTRPRRVRGWVALAVLCCGGLLPGTCMVRTKQAAVSGTKSFVASVLLNPGTVTDLPFDDLSSGLFR